MPTWRDEIAKMTPAQVRVKRRTPSDGSAMMNPARMLDSPAIHLLW